MEEKSNIKKISIKRNKNKDLVNFLKLFLGSLIFLNSICARRIFFFKSAKNVIGDRLPTSYTNFM